MASTLNASTSSGLISSGDTSGVLALQTNSGTTALTIDTSQNVGIGTSSPAYKLDVSGQVRINGNQLLIQNTTASSYADYNSTGGDLYVGLDNSAGSGLGTGTAYAASFVRTGAYPFIWRNNGSNNMTLDSSGNLLVGTTTSLAKATIIGGSSTVSTLNLTGGSAANDNATIASNYNLTFQIDATNTVGGRQYEWKYGGNGYSGGTSLASLDSQGTLYLSNIPSGNAHLKIQQGAVTTLGAVASSGVAIIGGGANNTICQIGLGYPGTYQPIAIASTTSNQANYTYADLVFATRSVNTDTAPSVRMTIYSSGNIGAPSGSNIYNASDARLKKNIQTLTKGLDAVNALKPVSFNWIDDFCPPENGKTMYGFVAQDTKEVDENLVEGFNDGSDVVVGDLTVEKAMRVNEKFIIPMLTKAIQELKAINDTQAETINALTARIVALEAK